MTRRLLDYGARAVLLECADLTEVLGLLPRIDRQLVPQLSDVVPGARTVLLHLDRPLTPAQRRALLTLQPVEPSRDDQAPLRIAVDYDGEDLDEVAAQTGLTAAQVVDAHVDQLWTVGFGGFAPGFAYLLGENERLRVSRRASPRSTVPAGAVGLADRWCGIYPRDGPGGWQLIGRTATTVWDLNQSPPALLQPGRRVRFVRASPGSVR